MAIFTPGLSNGAGAAATGVVLAAGAAAEVVEALLVPPWLHPAKSSMDTPAIPATRVFVFLTVFLSVVQPSLAARPVSARDGREQLGVGVCCRFDNATLGDDGRDEVVRCHVEGGVEPRDALRRGAVAVEARDLV